MWKSILNCDRLCGFLDHAGFNRDLWWARLEDQTGLWLHNFLRSILNIVRLLENIRRFFTCWTSFDFLAFHNFVQSFVTATALEILRQMFSQYLQVLITFRAFVHMNQSLCTSWCFIKSIKMQIIWSWMNEHRDSAPELERHRGSKFVWVQFYFHHWGMEALQVCSEL